MYYRISEGFCGISQMIPPLKPREKSIFKMLQIEILGGVIVDGDDVKTDCPVVVDEFLVLGSCRCDELLFTKGDSYFGGGGAGAGFDFYKNEGVAIFGDDVDLCFVGRPVGFQDGVAGRNEVFQGDGLTPVSFLPCRWIFQMPNQDSYSLPCGMETIFLDFLNNPVMAAFKNFKTLLMRL
jgi:hypothetical protein